MYLFILSAFFRHLECLNFVGSFFLQRHYKIFCVNGNTGFKLESRIFILYICKMKKLMKEKNQVVPDEVLSKEFLSQFKTEADVSKFLKQLHAQA